MTMPPMENAQSLEPTSGAAAGIFAVLRRRLLRLAYWHVDGALRYLPVGRLVRRHGDPGSSILELGSGDLGLSLFLDRPVVGCDISFGNRDLGLLRQAKARAGGEALPFSDREFDFVLSMDMIEHVPPPDRGFLIREMLRVAQSWVIVGLPCGDLSMEYDARLYEWLKSRFGLEYKWLKEHLRFGLSDASDIEDEMRRAIGNGNGWDLTIENNLNINVWFWIWKFQMSRSNVWRSVKNKLLWPLIPYFSRRNEAPAYRKVFILQRK
jgi:hypothetical protein